MRQQIYAERFLNENLDGKCIHYSQEVSNENENTK